MPIENDFLRVYLIFLNGLEEVQAMPARVGDIGIEI